LTQGLASQLDLCLFCFSPFLLHVALLLNILQLIAALGIFNVWLLRAARSTPYRGGNAKTMREEFQAYGLPFWFMCVIGVLKLGFAVALLVAIWSPVLARPAALGLGALMLGALGMHLKIKDPLSKAIPASLMLTLCAAIAFLPLLGKS
jgi:DoxX-like family